MMLMRIKRSKFAVISLLRRAVLTHFIVKKALSHSAVLTGRIRVSFRIIFVKGGQT